MGKLCHFLPQWQNIHHDPPACSIGFGGKVKKDANVPHRLHNPPHSGKTVV